MPPRTATTSNRVTKQEVKKEKRIKEAFEALVHRLYFDEGGYKNETIQSFASDTAWPQAQTLIARVDGEADREVYTRHWQNHWLAPSGQLGAYMRK